MRQLALIALVGCWTSSSTPAVAPIDDTNQPPPKRAPRAMDTGLIELQITEGTPAALPDGITVDVTGLGYAHMQNSENLSHATLVVTANDGQRTEVPLMRYHKQGGADETRWGAAHGWEFQLQYADPYQQPGNAGVHARRAQP